MDIKPDQPVAMMVRYLSVEGEAHTAEAQFSESKDAGLFAKMITAGGGVVFEVVIPRDAEGAVTDGLG